MKDVKVKRIEKVRCVACRQLVPGFDVVNAGSLDKGYRTVCSRCFNTELAEAAGLEKFEHITFDPVEIRDCAGERHEFYFRTHLFGTGVALDAFELRDGRPTGYQFQTIGEPETDLLLLLGKLIEKIRHGLSAKHLRCEPNGVQIAGRVVRGTVEWDELQNGSVPLLNVDGRPITWEEFGRMLMSFEGSQFKLEIRDKSEDL